MSLIILFGIILNIHEIFFFFLIGWVIEDLISKWRLTNTILKSSTVQNVMDIIYLYILAHPFGIPIYHWLLLRNTFNGVFV